jgi:aminoglycoside 3-N-acetyltransferase
VLSLLKKIIPPQLLPALRKVWRLKHRADIYSKKIKGELITETQLIAQLKQAGISQGDSLLVHSSLRKIGYVQQGATTVIQALINTLGTNGTLLMPAFPAKGYNKDYLLHNTTFNYHTTPSSMGVVTEVFRTQYATHRSLHATDSVCAWGANADCFTNTHLGQVTPYNEESPFYKLCKAQGKILLLGVDLNSLTNFHTLEDAVEHFIYPVYDAQEFEVTLIDKNNAVHLATTKVHNPEYSTKRQCLAFENLFINDGIMCKTKIGNATSYLIDAHKLHTWMLHNYQTKKITLYTPQGTPQ